MDKINYKEALNKTPKKRVLFVITQEDLGGAQRFLNAFVSHLDTDKFETEIAVGDAGTKEFIKKNFEKNNTAAHRLDNLTRDINFLKDIKAVFELKKLYQKTKPDVIFLISSKAGFIGSLAARNSRCLVIYRIGGWTFNDPWPKWKKWLFIFLEKISAKWKDYIVVNNLHDFEQAKKFKINPRKELKLIHNGIDALKIEFLEKVEARKKLKLPQEGLIMGTIANFYPTKGLEYFVEATKKLTTHDSRLTTLIIGDGPERTNLESKIKNYGLEKNVTLLGQIPDAYKYLKALDVFVLPSVKEGFPWAVLEAMAAKVPVVATAVGALPEIIENGKNGLLVEPKNAEQLAEAIKYLLENERAGQELSLQAHQTVLHKFPIEKMVKETEELFSDENHH